MPLLDLGNFGSEFDRNMVGVRLLAHMAYPDVKNDGSRREFAVTVLAGGLGRLNEPDAEVESGISAYLQRKKCEIQRARPDLDGRFIDEFLDGLRSHAKEMVLAETNSAFTREGGFGGVAKAKGWDALIAEIRKRIPEGLACGAVLLAIIMMDSHGASIRGGASVKKAVRLFEEWRIYEFMPQHERNILALWRKYISSAHLWAALLYLSERNKSLDIDAILSRDNEAFLSVASAFEGFARNFIPHGRQGAPLIRREEMWCLPEYRGRTAAANLPPIPPLPEAALEILSRYRAPS